MTVAKTIEVIAGSTKSIEDAVTSGLKKVSETVSGIEGAWIKDTKAVVRNGDVTEWRVTLAVSIGAIVDALGEGFVRGMAARTLGGFAASGDSLRGVIESLSAASPLALADDGAALLLTDAPAAAAPILASERGADVGDARREARSVGSALAVPADLAVSYYEPARDYQAGLQRARRPGPGRRGERIELPAALSAGEAKAVAEAALARAWTGRETRTVRLPWRRIDLAPGRIVALADETGEWRIARRTIDRMMIEIELVRHRTASAAVPVATPGRGSGAVDIFHGPTVAHLIELPPLGDELLSAPRLFVAAAGPSPGWRRAALMLSLDDGARWEPVGGTALPAVIGTAAGALGAADAGLIDARNSVEVQLLHDAMLLEDADDAGLVAGANMALIGDELVQFARATPLGDARWRIERLARGRRGTEWAIAGHLASERFVLIERDALAVVDVALSAIGGNARLLATGIGDAAAGVETAAVIRGDAVRPPAPVGLRAELRGDGGYDVRWTRRSRSGWGWTDGGDAPLGEERELYSVGFARGDGSIRSIEATVTGCDYSAGDVAADGALGATVTIRVVQRGTVATSRAAELALTIG